jgi:hypothetical protein
MMPLDPAWSDWIGVGPTDEDQAVLLCRERQLPGGMVLGHASRNTSLVAFLILLMKQ